MTTKKKARLGRGLGALLGDVKVATENDAQEAKTSSAEGSQIGKDEQSAPDTAVNFSGGYRKLGVELLQRGKYQPRENMDKEALQTLADSIAAQGVIAPILVRPVAHNQYEIIAGERRWRAAQLAGLQEVPVVIREMEDQTAMAIGLIENIQRENLNAVEEAEGFLRLADEFGLSHQEIADAVGRSRAAVSNFLRLLSLSEPVLLMLREGDIEMGHARALLSLDAHDQLVAAKQVVQQKMSVRQAEQLVKNILSPKQKAQADSEQSNRDVAHLEEELSQRLGAKVQIKHKGKKGQLIVQYYSLDELDGIIAKIH